LVSTERDVKKRSRRGDVDDVDMSMRSTSKTRVMTPIILTMYTVERRTSRYRRRANHCSRANRRERFTQIPSCAVDAPSSSRISWLVAYDTRASCQGASARMKQRCFAYISIAEVLAILPGLSRVISPHLVLTSSRSLRGMPFFPPFFCG
jgi:hypothetical protein